MKHFIQTTNLTGMALSFLCVIHCLMMPVLLAKLPESGLEWLASPLVHQVLAVAGIAIGIVTLVPGWRLHGRLSVLILAFGGLFIMNHSAFLGENCCAAEQQQVGSNEQGSAGACCTKACCAVSKPETTQADATPVELAAGPSQSANQFFAWLMQHPTILGALLLGIAHLRNGQCCHCCKKAAAEELPVVEVA